MSRSLEGLLDHAQEWATRAEAFIIKNGWSITDENRVKIIQETAVYLMHIDKLGIKLERKDCYVVHSQDKNWRFQTVDRNVAFQKFKDAGKNERVGMFHWDDRCNCRRLFTSDNYTLTRDY